MIKIARDFSKTPGARYEHEGEHSGNLFRRVYLYPAIRRAIDLGFAVCVDLDGTAGYSSGFLDEAFGGLVFDNNYTPDELKHSLYLISEEESYLIEDIWQYIKAADQVRLVKLRLWG